MSSNTKVAVVDNAMVVSFLPAGEMRALRLDMAHGTSATVEMQEGKDSFTLLLNKNAVATFTERKKAEAVFNDITQALFAGGGQAAPAKAGWFKKLLKVVAGIVVVLILMMLFLKPPAPPSGSGEISTAPVKEGVPMPADALFGK